MMNFKQFLYEDLYKTKHFNDTKVPIYLNPKKDEVLSVGEHKENFNRGMIDIKNKNLFVWSGNSEMLHDGFSNDLFVNYIPIYLHNNNTVESMLYTDEDEKFKTWVLSIIKDTKGVKKYYNNKVKDIYITNFH